MREGLTCLEFWGVLWEKMTFKKSNYIKLNTFIFVRIFSHSIKCENNNDLQNSTIFFKTYFFL